MRELAKLHLNLGLRVDQSVSQLTEGVVVEDGGRVDLCEVGQVRQDARQDVSWRPHLHQVVLLGRTEGSPAPNLLPAESSTGQSGSQIKKKSIIVGILSVHGSHISLCH